MTFQKSGSLFEGSNKFWVKLCPLSHVQREQGRTEKSHKYPIFHSSLTLNTTSFLVIEIRMNSGRELIMVVDDEHDILQIIRAGLTRYGHKVMIFSDPVLALKEFELNHSDYSLILTDLRMPSMSGIELGLKVKQIDSQVRLMIMTAFELSAYELSHDLPYIKSEDLLRKPISLSSVCKAISDGITSH